MKLIINNLFIANWLFVDESEENSEKNCKNSSVLCQPILESDLKKIDDKNNTSCTIVDKPWQALVSYVDELTVGGRKNSKGQFTDGIGTFLGFGKKKKPRDAPACFPSNVYDK